jgi:hypothetical protein
MSSPRHDDDSFSVDFSSELTSAFDFGGQFELTGDSLFPFGSYENEYDDASFSFSVESYVGVRNRNRRIRKKRRPNRQFRKKSVKKSCWYREFLRPGITRDLFTVHSLVPEMTRKSLRTIPTFIWFDRDGIKMYCGIITQQKAELSRIAVHI